VSEKAFSFIREIGRNPIQYGSLKNGWRNGPVIASIHMNFGVSSTERNERPELKGKILLVIALYAILGVIGFFNFGFHHHLSERVGLGNSSHEAVRKNIAEDMNIQTTSPQESQDSLSGQGEND
jgi:hypothetical protein